MGDIGGFGAKSQAKQSSANRKKTLGLLGQYGDAGKYAARTNALLPMFRALYEPQRRQSADLAALTEQRGLQDINTQAGRTGMMGSGAQLYARAAQRGERQAAVNEAMMQKYLNAFQGASQNAIGSQNQLLSAISGVPMAVTAPSAGAAMADTGMNALALYLMKGGGGTNYAKAAGMGGYSYP